MTKIAIVIAFVQAAMMIGILFIIAAIGRAISPTFVMPFSPWWGALFCIPGLLMARIFSNFWNGRF